MFPKLFPFVGLFAQCSDDHPTRGDYPHLSHQYHPADL